MHPDATVRAVAALARAGLNASEVAQRTGVPRSTVREWMRGLRPNRSRSDTCRRCGGPRHGFDALPATYVYLLGMYLGDGCISEHPRKVYRLRLYLDAAYPGIIDECTAAIQVLVPNNNVGRLGRTSNYVASPERSHFEVSAYSKSWPCLFPQHGPGKKHERGIVLADWQRGLVEQHPWWLLRGLIHSDGCRFINTGRAGWRQPRYSFSNLSDDIRSIFCEACDLLGIGYTFAPHTVYVSRKADVARLDEFIGPKA